MSNNNNIKVAVRVKPVFREEEKDSIYWEVEGKRKIYQVSSGSESFCFDRVFRNNETNADIYQELCIPIVDSVMEGFNGTILAYGQTASGKTFTMMGHNEDPFYTEGIIHYIILNIFRLIEENAERDFLLRVSFLEIYKEKVYDLLSEKEDLILREDADGYVNVIGLEEPTVQNSEQIFKLMSSLEKRRTAPTAMNRNSSRSHLIFRMIIESKAKDDDEVILSQLNLVDLAGSENASLNKTNALRFKEGISINTSLLTLSKVISQLSEKSEKDAKYINYRESKLTRLLQNSLGGNALTAIICTVTPVSLKETLSTLQFASRAKKIKNKPEKNEFVSDRALLKKLADKIKKLNEELGASKQQEKELEEKRKQNEDLKQQIEILQANFVTRNVAVDRFSKTNRRETWGGNLSGQHLKKFILQRDILHSDVKFPLQSIVEENDGDLELSDRLSFNPRRSSFLSSTTLSAASNKNTACAATQTDPDNIEKLNEYNDAMALVEQLKADLMKLQNQFDELSEFTTLEKQKDGLNEEVEALKLENASLRETIESSVLLHSKIIEDKMPSRRNSRINVSKDKTIISSLFCDDHDDYDDLKLHNIDNLQLGQTNDSISEDMTVHTKFTDFEIMNLDLKSNFSASCYQDLDDEETSKLETENKTLRIENEKKDKQIILLKDKLEIKEQLIHSLENEVTLCKSRNCDTSKILNVSNVCNQLTQVTPIKVNEISTQYYGSSIEQFSQTSPVKKMLKCYENERTQYSKILDKFNSEFNSVSDIERNANPVNCHSDVSTETSLIVFQEAGTGLNVSSDFINNIQSVKVEDKNQSSQVTPIKLKDSSTQCKIENYMMNITAQTTPLKLKEELVQTSSFIEQSLKCIEQSTQTKKWCTENFTDTAVLDQSSQTLDNEQKIENLRDYVDRNINNESLGQSLVSELVQTSLFIEHSLKCTDQSIQTEMWDIQNFKDISVLDQSSQTLENEQKFEILQDNIDRNINESLDQYFVSESVQTSLFIEQSLKCTEQSTQTEKWDIQNFKDTTMLDQSSQTLENEQKFEDLQDNDVKNINNEFLDQSPISPSQLNSIIENEIKNKLNELKTHTLNFIRDYFTPSAMERLAMPEPNSNSTVESELTALDKLLFEIKHYIINTNESFKIISDDYEAKTGEVALLNVKLLKVEEILSNKEKEICILNDQIADTKKNLSDLIFTFTTLKDIETERELNAYKNELAVTPKNYFYGVENIKEIVLKINSYAEENALKLVKKCEKNKELEKEMLELKQKIEKLNVQSDIFDSMKSNITEKENIILQLERDNSNLKVEIENLKADTTDQINKLKTAYSAQVQALEETLKNSESSWNTKTTLLVSNLEEKYEKELTELENKLFEEKEKYIIQINKKENEIKSLQCEISKIEEELNNSNSEKDNLKGQLKKMQEENSSFRMKFDEIVNMFKEKSQKQKDIVSDLRFQNNLYLKEIEDLKERNKSYSSEAVEELKKTVNELTIEKDELKESVEELTKKVKEVTNEKGTLNRKYDAAKQYIQELKNEMQKFNNPGREQKLQSRLRETEERNQNLLSIIDQKAAKILSLETNNSNLVQEIKRLKDMLSKSNVCYKCKSNLKCSTAVPSHEDKNKGSHHELAQRVGPEGMDADTILPSTADNKDGNKDFTEQERILLLGGGSGAANSMKCYWLQGMIHKKDKEILNLKKEIKDLKSKLQSNVQPIISNEKYEAKNVLMGYPHNDENVTVYSSAPHPYSGGAIPKIQHKQILREKNFRVRPYKQEHLKPNVENAEPPKLFGILNERNSAQKDLKHATNTENIQPNPKKSAAEIMKILEDRPAVDPECKQQ